MNELLLLLVILYKQASKMYVQEFHPFSSALSPCLKTYTLNDVKLESWDDLCFDKSNKSYLIVHRKNPSCLYFTSPNLVTYSQRITCQDCIMYKMQTVIMIWRKLDFTTFVSWGFLFDIFVMSKCCRFVHTVTLWSFNSQILDKYKTIAYPAK